MEGQLIEVSVSGGIVQILSRDGVFNYPAVVH